MKREGEVARVRELIELLLAPDPWPDDLDESGQDAWMDRVEADGTLAGMLQSAMSGASWTAAEVATARSKSDSVGSRLDPNRLLEAYRLLGRS